MLSLPALSAWQGVFKYLYGTGAHPVKWHTLAEVMRSFGCANGNGAARAVIFTVSEVVLNEK